VGILFPQNQFVMAGPVPASHILLSCKGKKDVDARHKAGHDEEC
jgi:hypothetical protein